MSRRNPPRSRAPPSKLGDVAFVEPPQPAAAAAPRTTRSTRSSTRISSFSSASASASASPHPSAASLSSTSHGGEGVATTVRAEPSTSGSASRKPSAANGLSAAGSSSFGPPSQTKTSGDGDRDGLGTGDGAESDSLSDQDPDDDVPPTQPIVVQRDAKRAQLHNARLADSVKRFRYLLGQTELFQHFIDMKKSKDPAFAALVDGVTATRGTPGQRKSGRAGRRRKRGDQEEDEDLEEEDEAAFVFEQSPGYVKGGNLRTYQIDGLNWMISLYHHGINGILADEMGLGKTLQTISFLGYLKYMCDKPGFHLVVVPKSTLDNWRREFEKWIPGFNTVVLTGDRDERKGILRERVLAEKFDVLITTYEMCLKEKGPLLRISWEYIVIDEAHRIKNANSMLSQIVRAFDSRGRLLITGTPLQNNLMELWSLLNFLLPDVFSDAADFERWFAGKTADKEDDAAKGDEQDAIVKQLHKVLRPFLLRRVKADVEKSLLPKKEINLFIGLTEMQRTWYKALLKKDVDAVTGINARKEGKSRLQNIVMQLRKCCNHPYLFEGAEPDGMEDEQHLVDNAGKMVILDKLLARMKEKGSRVLIFSQMGRMLDILSDYCTYRDYDYSRIDGSTAHEERVAAIDEFNAPDSKKFIFLLTTRAGGLGINLTTADVVLLYDSDWNPQADLQAMDRAHRIGQTKQVYVFRFVTEHTVEERVLERATQKLRLDQLVIQQGRHQEKQKAQQNKEDLVDAIKHGADKIISGEGGMLIDENIDNIIADGEKRTAALQARYEDVGIDVLNSIQNGERPDWAQGVNGTEGEANEEALNKLWMEPTKRERRVNYSEYYGNDPLTKSKAPAVKLPKAPKQIHTTYFHFYPLRFLELQQREINVFHRKMGFRVPRREPARGETWDQVEAERARDQAMIDSAEDLTEDELADKEALIQQAFLTWQKNDFTYFVRASEKYGPQAYAAIAQEMSMGHRRKRTEDEVRRYAHEFWSRGAGEVPNWTKISSRIREGEAKVQKAIHDELLLRNKMNRFNDPLRQIKLLYGSNKGQRYALEQDRWLLMQLAEFGLQNPDDVFARIHQEIQVNPLLRFDYWMKSRTITEITRRCNKLIPIFLKGEPGYVEGPGRKNAKGKRQADDGDAEVQASEGEESNDDVDTSAPASKKPKLAASL